MPATYRFGAVEVRPATQQLLIGGLPAALGARAFDLLLALIERRERLVPKHELLDTVWRGQVVEEGNLHVQVSTLRKLLGPAVITNVPGRGYRFAAALEGADNSPARPAPEPPEPAPRRPGNLGVLPPPLLGRQAELQALLAQIEAQRLVTVVGAAGMGKTALAQAAAHAAAHDFGFRWRDGAWWVDLAPVSEPAGLPQAVAQALRIALPASGSAAQHLQGVLASMSLLLVLDNCEHLVDAAGAFAGGIIRHAGGVQVLATSQELLNVPGEALFPLGPLALPAADPAPDSAADRDAADALQFGAVRLFVERAQAAGAHLEMSAANVQAVVDICRRLDGLPLAIELAAARVRLLGVQGLRDRLGERFRVLTGGARTAMRRHQTLRAALDWSHGLLSAAEQVVLRRLGVFVGGFALELAQAVAGDEALDEWAVLDALGGLVDKSLVVVGAGTDGDPPRYRLLETTRAYALEKLAEAGEGDAWLARHAQAVCALFERYEEARRGEQGWISNVAFVDRTAPELDNARAALDWADAARAESATAAVNRLDLAAGLAGAATLTLGNLSLAVEAADRLMHLQRRFDASVSPARAALCALGLAILGQSGRVPLPVAQDAAARAEAFYRAQGSPRRLHGLLAIRVHLWIMAGEWPSAQRLLPEMQALEAPGWRTHRGGMRLRAQGWVHLAQGQYQQALDVFTEMRRVMLGAAGERRNLLESETELCRCLTLAGRPDECITLAQSVIAREGGSTFGAMPVLWRQLMLAQARSGRIAEARQTLLAAMPSWRRHGIIQASNALAVVLAEGGALADAARVGAASLAYQHRMHIQRHPWARRTTETWQALIAAAACDPEDLARWQREGEALDEAAIEAICLRAAQAALPAQDGGARTQSLGGRWRAAR